MSDGFSIKLGPGRPLRGGDLLHAFERHMDPAMIRAALVLQRAGQRVTPVGTTGNLRRSWAHTQPTWVENRVRRVKLGPGAIYARRVNRVSKKNKGYIERGFGAGKAEALRELNRGVGELARHLWRNR